MCEFCLVPDLETVKYKVLSRRDQYEIREVEVLYWKINYFDCFLLCLGFVWLFISVVVIVWNQPYFIAEATMPGKTGFDFNGASQSFNVLAEYLFGKVLWNFFPFAFEDFSVLLMI